MQTTHYNTLSLPPPRVATPSRLSRLKFPILLFLLSSLLFPLFSPSPLRFSLVHPIIEKHLNLQPCPAALFCHPRLVISSTHYSAGFHVGAWHPPQPIPQAFASKLASISRDSALKWARTLVNRAKRDVNRIGPTVDEVADAILESLADAESWRSTADPRCSRLVRMGETDVEADLESSPEEQMEDGDEDDLWIEIDDDDDDDDQSSSDDSESSFGFGAFPPLEGIPPANPSQTPSATPSPSASLSPSSSATPIPSASVTPSPSATASPTVSATSSATPSVTASMTPSLSPSATASVTVTPSPSPSATASVTVTPSPPPSSSPALFMDGSRVRLYNVGHEGYRLCVYSWFKWLGTFNGEKLYGDQTWKLERVDNDGLWVIRNDEFEDYVVVMDEEKDYKVSAKKDIGDGGLWRFEAVDAETYEVWNTKWHKKLAMTGNGSDGLHGVVEQVEDAQWRMEIVSG